MTWIAVSSATTKVDVLAASHRRLRHGTNIDNQYKGGETLLISMHVVHDTVEQFAMAESSDEYLKHFDAGCTSSGCNVKHAMSAKSQFGPGLKRMHTSNGKAARRRRCHGLHQPPRRDPPAPLCRSRWRRHTDARQQPHPQPAPWKNSRQYSILFRMYVVTSSNLTQQLVAA